MHRTTDRGDAAPRAALFCLRLSVSQLTLRVDVEQAPVYKSNSFAESLGCALEVYCFPDATAVDMSIFMPLNPAEDLSSWRAC